MWGTPQSRLRVGVEHKPINTALISSSVLSIWLGSTTGLTFDSFNFTMGATIDTEEKQSQANLEHSISSSDHEAHDAIAAPQITPEMEKKILRKMDIHLIPMLALLYLLAFLDRGNIGNAKIEGLLDDLNMSGHQYSMACKSPEYVRGSELIHMPCCQ